MSELDLVGRAADLASARDRERVGRGRAAAVPAARRGVRERARPRRRLLPHPARMTRRRSTRSRLSAEEARGRCSTAAARSRRASELWDAYRAAIDARNEELNAYLTLVDEPRRRRRADRAQGRDLDEGHPHDRRLEDPRELRPGLRLDRRRPLQGGGAAGARQDEHRRVRDGLLDRELGLRPDAQPVGPDAASRAARAAARRPRSRPGSRRGRSAPTPAARSSCPSAFCGNVGLRPTYGTVSRYGIVAFASSLDQVGPVTRNVRDNALLYGIISGRDENDSTTVDVPAGRAARAGRPEGRPDRPAAPAERGRGDRAGREGRRRRRDRARGGARRGDRAAASCRSRSTTACPATT